MTSFSISLELIIKWYDGKLNVERENKYEKIVLNLSRENLDVNCIISYNFLYFEIFHNRVRKNQTWNKGKLGSSKETRKFKVTREKNY